jgi:RNA polymerase sigma factor (sigma-70 family)
MRDARDRDDADQARRAALVREYRWLIDLVVRRQFGKYANYADTRLKKGTVLDRDDLAQEATIGVLRALDAHDPARGEFKHIARACIKSHVRDALKTARRRREAEEARRGGRPEVPLPMLTPDPDAEGHWAEADRDDLRARIDALDEPGRAILRLWSGIDPEGPTSVVEAGRRLGLTRDRAQYAHRRALDELRKTYGPAQVGTGGD